MVSGKSGVPTRPPPRAVGVITNHTGFDVEGRRTIDILAKAPGIKLVAIFSPEHGVTGELDVNSVGDSVDLRHGRTYLQHLRRHDGEPASTRKRAPEAGCPSD